MTSGSLTGARFPILSRRKSLRVPVPDVVPSPPGLRVNALNIARGSGVVGEQRGRGMLIPWKNLYGKKSGY